MRGFANLREKLGLDVTILILIVTWLFLPQLSGPFEVKQYVVCLGIPLVTIRFLVLGTNLAWNRPRGLLAAALVTLIVAATISTLAATNNYLAITQLGQLTLYVALLILLLNIKDISLSQERIELALVFAAGGVALYGLKQWAFPTLLDPGFQAPGKMRIYSTLGNANLVAFVLLAAMPIAFFRARCAARLHRVGYSAVFILLLTCLVATHSRQSLLAALLLVPIAFAWLGSSMQRGLAIAVLALVLAVSAATYIFLGADSDFFHTLRGRVLIWLSAWQMWIQQPLVGIGLGQFDLHYSQTQAALFATGQFDSFVDNASAPRDAHNDFNQWGATTGMIGIVGFATLCGIALLRGWAAPALRREHPGIYLSLVGCVCVMMFTAVLPHPSTALIFWLILGLVLRQCALPSMGSSVSKFTYTATITTLCIALLVGGVWSYRDFRARFAQNRADRYMEQHDLWLAERTYHEALSWSRYDGLRLRQHATTLFLIGQPDEALIELGEAAQFSGDSGIPILQAEILTRLGRYDQAIAIYSKVIAAFPKMLTPRFVLAQIYAKRGDHELAENQFKMVIDISPSTFNSNMTPEKVEMQKTIARRYLENRRQTAR